MKKLIFVIPFLAASAFGGGTLLKSLTFEDEKGFQAWPGDCTVELDEEEFTEGKKSIVFTPDNNFVVYFWQQYRPGVKYAATFKMKAEKTLIPRITFAVNFKKADRSSAGTFAKPLKDLAPCDNEWHDVRVEFTCPEGAVRGQTMLSMFRCNTTVFIDDFKLYELDGSAAAAPAPAAVASGSSGKRKMLIEVEFDGDVPSVKSVRAVK